MGSPTEQCDRLDAYSTTYSNNRFDTYQTWAMADLALFKDLYTLWEGFSGPQGSWRVTNCWSVTFISIERNTTFHAIPVAVQVLSTLVFLATRTFQREIRDRSGISQPTMSRMMPAVSVAIKSLSREYITFPYDDAQQAVIKREFYETAGLTNVTGATNCIHVCLKPPLVNDCAFINCKSDHSINVHVICDACLSLLNMVARWLGGPVTLMYSRTAAWGCGYRRVHCRVGVISRWVTVLKWYSTSTWMTLTFCVSCIRWQRLSPHEIPDHSTDQPCNRAGQQCTCTHMRPGWALYRAAEGQMAVPGLSREDSAAHT